MGAKGEIINNKNGNSVKKKFLFSVTLGFFLLLVLLMVGELSIRIIAPQESMYPRWKFSNKYGAELFGNTQMVHERPGLWKYKYSINEYQYRGKITLISEKYSRENIIILGDSYSFGTGVNDGEEFAAVMGNKLKEKYNIINLSVGGWGLTQQIRKYYEFGEKYYPKIVLLQFCENDPRDNFKNKVVIVENGKFKFQDSSFSINVVKKYLSKSFIQKSQIYNLFRNNLYLLFSTNTINKDIELYKANKGNNEESLPEEQFYTELIDLFVNDLNNKGVKVMMIAVESQLDNFPAIKAKVLELNSIGLIEYQEVMSWLKNITDYGTPEGHAWGEKAHLIIGEKIADIIKIAYSK